MPPAMPAVIRRAMTRMLLLFAAAAGSLAIAAAASAATGGVTPTRQPVSVDFTLPDICTFPIRVHTEGWIVTTPHGSVLQSTATLANADLTRSLTQQNHSVVLDVAADGGSWYVYLEKIVLPGAGVVYGTMGRIEFFFDDEGNVVGSAFVGRSDPYSTYTAVVCGYLAG